MDNSKSRNKLKKTRIILKPSSTGPSFDCSQTAPNVGSSNPGIVQLSQADYDRNFGLIDDVEEDEENADHLAAESDENVDEEDEEDVDDDEGVIKIPSKRGHGGKSLRGISSSSSTTSVVKSGRKKTDEWRVKVPEAGGPEVGDLIPSFGAHVAKALWANPDVRGVLTPKTREKVIGMLRLWDLPTEAMTLVKGSNLSHLVECMHTHLDMPLLTAFVERWL